MVSIELGRLELTLSQYPTVQQCVVTATVEDDKRLVAYIVSNSRNLPTNYDASSSTKSS